MFVATQPADFSVVPRFSRPISGEPRSDLFPCPASPLSPSSVSRPAFRVGSVKRRNANRADLRFFLLASLRSASGTIAAPVYCGYITQYIGWRWVEWIHVSSAKSRFPRSPRSTTDHWPLSFLLFPSQMIANGILFGVEFFFFKETRGAKILAVRAKALRKETKDESFVPLLVLQKLARERTNIADLSSLLLDSVTDLPPTSSLSP